MKKNSFLNYLTDPFSSLKNPRDLAKCAMLLALSVLSAYIISIYPTNYLKFSVTFLFVAAAAMQYGPIIAGALAALADVIGFIAKPVGPYQPLLTLSAAMTGVIFGIFLYKNKDSIWRIIVSRAVIAIFISTLLDTYFISILYGSVFMPLLISRGIKNLIMFPIEVGLLIGILKIVRLIDKRSIR